MKTGTNAQLYKCLVMEICKRQINLLADIGENRSQSLVFFHKRFRHCHAKRFNRFQFAFKIVAHVLEFIQRVWSVIS